MTTEFTGTLLGDHPHNTPAWYKMRSQGLGGSEIAAVVGLSPWTSAFALWHRKAGKLAEQVGSPSMDWGHRLEPVVADAFAERHPDLATIPMGTMRHKDRAWQIASIDRMLTADAKPAGILEVKTADAHDAFQWGRDGSGDIPAYYRCQAMWYLDTLSLPVSHIAVLIGGNDYREFVIEYAADEAGWLREEGRKFWQTVLDNTPPPIDGSDSTYQAVRQMHPDIDMTEEVEIDAATYDAWQENVTEAKVCAVRANLARSLIAEQMGSARYGTVMGERVIIRQSSKGNSPFLKLIPTKKEAA